MRIVECLEYSCITVFKEVYKLLLNDRPDLGIGHEKTHLPLYISIVFPIYPAYSSKYYPE